MTAEVAIMNKTAVALAADSAVSIDNGRKVYHTAEKLFTLDRGRPVGLMIYGHSEFMGVPWETLVNAYSNALGERRFDTFDEYVGDLIGFVEATPLFSAERQEAHVRTAAGAYFHSLRRRAEEGGERATNAEETEPGPDFATRLTQMLEKQWPRSGDNRCLAHMPPDYGKQIRKRYRATFAEVFDEVFEGAPFTGAQRRKLLGICPLLCTRDAFIPGAPVVVFAGFGERRSSPVSDQSRSRPWWPAG